MAGTMKNQPARRIVSPQRIKDDYVPTGFRGYGVKTRPVKGRKFGLQLSEERKALIALLKTL